MLTLPQNILIFCVTTIVSLTVMALMNRLWPFEKRQYGDDLIGWQLSVLGTTYAVILGFMLYTVWTNFGAATLNVDLEANALRTVYRLAEGLPQEQRLKLEAESRAYADAVVEGDWPAMAAGRVPDRSYGINEDMWRTLMQVKASTPSEITAQDHALSELSDLTARRRTRLLQSVYRLPFIFWAVLLIGAALTLLSVIMFGSVNRRLHTLQVFSLTILITLVMLAISDVNQPFRGWVCVSDYAFQRAQQTMHMP
ncbi:DUF4239 domain-containing protein [Dyella sp. S184]|uniref:bestrophin-like domain n=1 Tax=Dyella sp. S184 TaxID=1641862 RepID=UPI00131D3C51|nr:DUF4239 domain-containing protein [Dyella sp. S184]